MLPLRELGNLPINGGLVGFRPIYRRFPTNPRMGSSLTFESARAARTVCAYFKNPS